MSERPQVSETEAYYHALYHLIAHWAAYVAMMGILLTIGFFLCLTPISNGAGHSRRLIVIGLIIVCSFVAAIYFAHGMKTYGEKEVNPRLPSQYKIRIDDDPLKTLGMAHFGNADRRLLGAYIAAIVIAAIDLLVLYMFWR